MANPIGSYFDVIDGVEVLVRQYECKMPRKIKRMMKNDTFYATKMRITDDRLFAPMTRRKGKA
jgi:hypothetical protein